MKIDYNSIMDLKDELEVIYEYFRVTHKNLLKIIEFGDCFDDEKKEILSSYIKEYESKISLLKSDFYLLDSENKKIESCLSDVKLLKKKRLTKLKTRIGYQQEEEEYDPNLDLPF